MTKIEPYNPDSFTTRFIIILSRFFKPGRWPGQYGMGNETVQPGEVLLVQLINSTEKK